ncbi:MAG: polysaccharide export protein [candidate division KSB1 bacterium]|nr:polysaccharide export protein [candidate division KSB1 bacterium]
MSYFKTFAVLTILTCVLNPSGVPGQERKIQPGDALEIKIYEHEELSQAVTVSPEGTVDFPFLQGIPVDGITLERFQEILIAQLSRYMERRPLVVVRFTESYPIKVTVLGQVARPGLYSILNTTTLQGAIGAAGGFVPGAQLSQIKLIRQERGKANNQVVNMERFYLEGDPTCLPLLKDGDTIVVPGNPLATTLKVLGSVERPGSYEVSFRTSLMDVLFLAGGPTDEANLNDIKVVSLTGQNTREVRINIKDLMKSKNPETIPFVEPGDMVYVPQKTITWKKFVGVMRDITTFATLYIIIRWGRRW